VSATPSRRVNAREVTDAATLTRLNRPKHQHCRINQSTNNIISVVGVWSCCIVLMLIAC
jgi:hypothetical protein